MDIYFNQEVLENFIRGLGIWGPIVFFLLQVLQVVAAPVPGNLFSVVGGMLFGIWPGFFLSYTANVVGSLLAFSIARKAGRVVMKKFVGSERFDKWMKIIGTESAASRMKILLILVVLLPFLPSDLMCLVAGVTPISYRAYTIIVITCRPWGQFAAVLVGVGSFHMPLNLLLPLVAALIVVGILTIYFAPRIESFAMKWTYKMTDRFSKRKG